MSPEEASKALVAWRNGLEISFSDNEKDVYVNSRNVMAITVTNAPSEQTNGQQNLWPERENV